MVSGNRPRILRQVTRLYLAGTLKGQPKMVVDRVHDLQVERIRRTHQVDPKRCGRALCQRSFLEDGDNYVRLTDNRNAPRKYVGGRVFRVPVDYHPQCVPDHAKAAVDLLFKARKHDIIMLTR